MVQSVRTAATVRSCVIDDYVTTVGHHPFHEVACDVTNGSVSSVVVAAIPSGDPAHVWTELERAVAAYPVEQRDPQRSRFGAMGPGASGEDGGREPSNSCVIDIEAVLTGPRPHRESSEAQLALGVNAQCGMQHDDYVATQIGGLNDPGATSWTLDRVELAKWTSRYGWTIGIALRIRRLGVRIPPSAPRAVDPIGWTAERRRAGPSPAHATEAAAGSEPTSTRITCIVGGWWTTTASRRPPSGLPVIPRSSVPFDPSWSATRPTSGQRCGGLSICPDVDPSLWSGTILVARHRQIYRSC